MAGISQSKLILKHLQVHKTITSMEAISLYGATRLSAIIFDLRKAGHNIVTHTNVCFVINLTIVLTACASFEHTSPINEFCKLKICSL